MADDDLPIRLNPLMFVRAEIVRGRFDKGNAPPLDEVVHFLCGNSVKSSAWNLCRRYLKLTKKSSSLDIVPGESTIDLKLVKPLHNAVASYMLGNYYATIALAGMVCEMLAIFLFEIHQKQIRSKEPDRRRRRKIQGSAFESFGQEKRVRLLSEFGVINDETAGKFDAVRETRRRHLHLFSEGDRTLQADAAACYHQSVDLVAHVLRVKVRDGRVALAPPVQRYLDRTKSRSFSKKPVKLQVKKAPPERG